MCDNTVIQNVPTKYDYKQVESRCGTTGIHGQQLQCERCEGKRPWWMCKHGIDCSEREMACSRCNAEYE